MHWTNLIAKLTMVLATNWTGVVKDGKELGYVTTNVVLRVETSVINHAPGNTDREAWQTFWFGWEMPPVAAKEFTLLSVPSDKAVWRETPSVWMTNHLFEGVVITNWTLPSHLVPDGLHLR